MDIRDMDKDALARFIFSGFHHYWNMEACRKVAAEIVEKNWAVEDKPVIEVGDVVKTINNPVAPFCLGEYIVRLILGRNVCLENGASIILYSVDKLQLIRKGPKEHRFEGIKWFGIQDGDAEILWPGSVDGSCQRDRISEFVSKSKTYDMTLKERAE